MGPVGALLSVLSHCGRLKLKRKMTLRLRNWAKQKKRVLLDLCSSSFNLLMTLGSEKSRLMPCKTTTEVPCPCGAAWKLPIAQLFTMAVQ